MALPVHDLPGERPRAVDDFPQPADNSQRRLMVLVSEADWDDAEFPQRIWSLAAPHGLPVVLLGKYSETADEARARRHLVSMGAAIRDDRVATQIQLHRGEAWIEQLQAIWQPGDLVICNRRPPLGWLQVPGSLSPGSGPPIILHVLAGPEPPEGSRRSLPLRLLSWGGILTILAGFLWVQVRLAQLPGDLLRLVLVCASVLAEVGLLWIWNARTA